MMKHYLKTSTNGISYNHKNDNHLPPCFHDDLQTLSTELWEETVAICRENWSELSILADSLTEKKWITKDEIEMLFA